MKKIFLMLAMFFCLPSVFANEKINTLKQQKCWKEKYNFLNKK